jgi:hypothetical protein
MSAEHDDLVARLAADKDLVAYLVARDKQSPPSNEKQDLVIALIYLAFFAALAFGVIP